MYSSYHTEVCSAFAVLTWKASEMLFEGELFAMHKIETTSFNDDSHPIPKTAGSDF